MELWMDACVFELLVWTPPEPDQLESSGFHNCIKDVYSRCANCKGQNSFLVSHRGRVGAKKGCENRFSPFWHPRYPRNRARPGKSLQGRRKQFEGGEQSPAIKPEKKIFGAPPLFHRYPLLAGNIHSTIFPSSVFFCILTKYTKNDSLRDKWSSS
jgi:hypothetical protein